jgi:peptidoglycan hydrolase CwlO-like protein
MKKLILTTILFISFFSAFAQKIDYPRIETDSLGQKIVLMTIQQAQKLDNNTDLLVMFENLDQSLGTYDSLCIKVVNEKDRVIEEQTIQIKNLKNSINVKDEKIVELQSKLSNKESEILTYQNEIKNKNTEIDLHIKEKRDIKWAYGAGGGVIGIIVGLVTGLLITQ